MSDKLREAALDYHRHPTPGHVLGHSQRGYAALSQSLLEREAPEAQMAGKASESGMPEADAANIASDLLRIAAGSYMRWATSCSARPVHFLTPSSTVRRIVDMTALAAVEAGSRRTNEQTSKGFSLWAMP